MDVKFKKLKRHNLRLMLTYVNKSKKIFKRIGTFNYKTLNLNIDYVPHVLKNGAVVSNNFFKILNNIKTNKHHQKIKYK